MNRLYNMKCYVAGPMDRVKDNGVGWRRDITPKLENMGICVLDPTNKPIDKGLEDIQSREYRQQLLKEERYSEFAKQVKLLRVIDLRMVDLADFLVVYVDPETHMCGTYEELFHANITKKPILMVIEGGKQKTPNWLFGVIDHTFLFNSFSDLMSHLNYLDTNLEEPPHFKRWTFFNDYTKMLPSRPYGTQNDGRKYKLTWLSEE